MPETLEHLEVAEFDYSPLFKGEFFQTKGKGENWLTFSFASEETVQRWFGTLTLSCKKGAMKKDRVKDRGVPFLLDHMPNYDNDLGLVRDVWLDKRVAYTDVEFNDKYRSGEVREQMLAGKRPNVSPMAVPTNEDAVEIVEDRGFWDYDVRYNEWQPYEISSVSMPANTKVGYGQGKLYQPKDANIGALIDASRRRYWQMSMAPDNPNPDPNNPNTGTTAVVDPPAGAEGLNANPGGQPIDTSRQPSPQDVARFQAQLAQEQRDKQAATDLAEIYRLGMENNAAELAQEHIKAGGSPTEFRDKLLSVKFHPTVRPSKLTNPNGHPDFSLSRLIRAKVWPDNAQYRAAADHEIECGGDLNAKAALGGTMIPFETYAQGGYKLGTGAPKGVQHVPFHAREERLAVTTANDSAGRAVETIWDFDRTVDFLVEDSDILAHCDVAMGLMGNVQVPIEATGATLGFNAEGAVQAASNPTFTHYNASPHMLSAQVEISKQSLVQTGGWIERRIRALIARQMRSEINRYLITGTGSANNQPNGIGENTNIPDHGPDAGMTYNDINWSDVVDVEEIVDNEWIPEMGRAWVCGRQFYKKMLTTLKGGSASSEYIMSAAGTRATRTIMGYPAVKTSFIGETALSTASSGTTRKGVVFYGNWLDMFVGFWDGIEVVVEGITNPAAVKITVMVMWDAVVARAKSFVNAAFS